MSKYVPSCHVNLQNVLAILSMMISNHFIAKLNNNPLLEFLASHLYSLLLAQSLFLELFLSQSLYMWLYCSTIASSSKNNSKIKNVKFRKL